MKMVGLKRNGKTRILPRVIERIGKILLGIYLCFEDLLLILLGLMKVVFAKGFSIIRIHQQLSH